MFEGMTVNGVNRPGGAAARLDLTEGGTAGPLPGRDRVLCTVETQKRSGTPRSSSPPSWTVPTGSASSMRTSCMLTHRRGLQTAPASHSFGIRESTPWPADGSAVRLIVQLTGTGPNYSEHDLPFAGPVWSPDGKALAYVVWEPAPEIPPPVRTPRRYSLHVAAADGSGSARVFAATGHGTIELDSIGWPSWSPDGERLAFMRHVQWDYDSERYSVGEEIDAPLGFTPYTIRRDGSDLREVAPGIPRVGWNKSVVLFPGASWSPDGTEILFGLGNGYLFVAQADGGGYRQVGVGTYASWSLDGSRIAVADPRGDGYVAYMLDNMRADGEVSSNGGGSGGTERVHDPATPLIRDYLWTIAPDGSDRRVLVRRNEMGVPVAVNPAPPKPKPWYRFW